jgi:hypothetical protein
VCGDRHEARKCAKAHTLCVVIQALEFEPVGPQNQWVDVMFLTMKMIAAGHKALQSFSELMNVCHIRLLDVPFTLRLIC